MKDILDLLKAFVKAIWPPRGEPGDLFRVWRVNVSVVSMLSFLGNILITLAALGYMSFIYPGAATAADVKAQTETMAATLDKVAATLASLQRGQLDEKMRDYDNRLTVDRTALCAAQRDSNLPAKKFAEDRFSSDYQTYYQLSGGVNWRIPDCSELI